MNAARPWSLAAATLAGVALLVAACGDDDDGAIVEFTGDDCVYSGPDGFELGDELVLTAVDTTDERADVGYSVMKVHDGTTESAALQQGFDAIAEDDGPGDFLWSEVTEEGTERELSVVLDTAGTWLVHCFVFGTGDPGGEMFPATTFEVTEP